MTAGMDVDVDADMDVGMSTDMYDYGPCIYGPISKVAQFFCLLIISTQLILRI
jgi:hypothetical protein